MPRISKKNLLDKALFILQRAAPEAGVQAGPQGFPVHTPLALSAAGHGGLHQLDEHIAEPI